MALAVLPLVLAPALAWAWASAIYLLAFRPLPGYRVVAVNAFDGFAGLRRGAVYTLAKLPV